MPVRIYIEIGAGGKEIRSGRITRHEFVHVSCKECNEILFSGKNISQQSEDLIWATIREHYNEHCNRELAGPK